MKFIFFCGLISGFAINVARGEELEERNYLNLVQHILNEGAICEDRTNTGTLSVFAPSPLSFDLSNGKIPLFTTKKIQPRIIFEELCWFLSGDTDAKTLKSRKVGIWNSNSSRQFLDERGLIHYQEGDIGPGYGFQWRHFGADYKGCGANHDGEGEDQIKNLLHDLVYNPNSRRHLVVAWNPSVLHECALPPCHTMFQFRRYGNTIHLLFQMRSADMFLGVPFNIFSYSLLLYMICHVLRLNAGRVTVMMGDAHVYLNHVDVARKQIVRQGHSFPTIKINSPLTGDTMTDLLAIRWEHIDIQNYKHEELLKAPMAV